MESLASPSSDLPTDLLADLATDRPADQFKALFADLNDAQREAVWHGMEAGTEPGTEAGRPDTRPLLVIAGAGSGKTDTLAHRVANLILHGADPQRILLLTFSRRAAAEMERRVASVLRRVLAARQGSGAGGVLSSSFNASSPPALPWAGTFHAIGARLLRSYAGRIGLEESFTIHDRGDAEDLLGLVRHDLNLSATHQRFPQKGTCLAIYSRVVNTQASLAEVLQTTFPWCNAWEAELKRLFRGYVEAKQAQNVLDYDDLLLFWSEMAAEPSLAAELGARFDHVLVDEYQDTNRLQASILLGMKSDGRGVTVVGDDAQSIYAFRGATVRNILNFPGQFSQPARIVTLDRNYRSTQPILDLSNAVIGQAKERHAKTLWTDKASATLPQIILVPDEADEARWVADRLLAHREAGLKLTSQAVLFRASSHSAMLELELTRRNIPFVKFGGLKFLEAAHVKDMLAILRFAQNPRGRLAGFRVVQMIPGIGPATASRLLDALAEAADPGAVVAAFVPPPAAAAEWKSFVSLYQQLRGAGREGGGGEAGSGSGAKAKNDTWPADIGLAKRWYQPHLERLYEDAEARQADVDNLERMASGYASREQFLTDLTLDPPEATSDQAGIPGLDEDYVILSTIHSAKGQEWQAVFVLRTVDGCIPSDMATGTAQDLEEERRLLYVALTRAKNFLHVLQPHKFYVTQQRAGGDRYMYALRTRFISEGMLKLVENLTWPLARDGSRLIPGIAYPVMQVRAKAAENWR